MFSISFSVYVLPVERWSFISAAVARLPAAASAGFAALVTSTFSLPAATSVDIVILEAIPVSYALPYELAVNVTWSDEP